FSYYRHYIHSCPTRRSSDLFKQMFRFFTPTYATLSLSPLPTQWGGGYDRRKSLWEGVGMLFNTQISANRRAAAFALCTLHFLLSDRKSTRLNSSHVKISYAV